LLDTVRAVPEPEKYMEQFQNITKKLLAKSSPWIIENNNRRTTLLASCII